jgi:hypothetical protein
MESVHGLTNGAVDGLKALFVGLALISVVLRLVANWKYNQRLLIDDCEFDMSKCITTL